MNTFVYSEDVEKFRQNYKQCVMCYRDDKTKAHLLDLLKSKKEYENIRFDWYLNILILTSFTV